MAKTALITGSSGLIGSEGVLFLDAGGWAVHGVDNNMRRDFFGKDGDTTWNLERVQRESKRYTHHDLDIRDREAIFRLFAETKPDLVFHCAAQPSHDLAASRPFDDFEINALATMNLLEAAREHTPESPFVFMSTNKVYGDAPNELPLVELETRWDYAEESRHDGIDENCRIDKTMHSLFGASKAAADLLVQEYGRYFGIPTACFRGGCLTGPNHAGARLHGFLSYLMRCTVTGERYVVEGYGGKQVRDNLHSADLVRAFADFHAEPRVAAVYNMGGGRYANCSMLEAIVLCEQIAGRDLNWELADEPRVGDHRWWISDLDEFRRDYPGWEPAYGIEDTLREIFEQNAERWNAPARQP